MIICPVCKEKLEKTGKTYRCINNHCFDEAKQGYTNLLLSKGKKTKDPGDDKQMIESRRNFLEKGFYKEISDVLNDKVKEYSKTQKLDILDIGCGEGYYTNLLEKELLKDEKKSSIIGIDISKSAVLYAARTYKGITWLVASAAELPIQEKSLDFVICMFTRIVPEENLRVLKDDGYLFVVSTGEDHLLDIKEVVYENVKKDFFRPTEMLNEKFNHLELINIKYKKRLENNQTIKDLFDMTPYKWKSPKKGVEKLFSLNELEVTVDVNLDIFSKK